MVKKGTSAVLQPVVGAQNSSDCVLLMKHLPGAGLEVENH